MQLKRRDERDLNSTDMARLAAGAALDKKALDPLALDLRGISSVSEFFVIITDPSERHVQAVAENVMDAFKSFTLNPRTQVLLPNLARTASKVIPSPNTFLRACIFFFI